MEKRKKRLIDEVTALSKAFAVAIPHENTLAIKDEVAYFQAIKARLVKLCPKRFDMVQTPGIKKQTKLEIPPDY